VSEENFRMQQLVETRSRSNVRNKDYVKCAD